MNTERILELADRIEKLPHHSLNNEFKDGPLSYFNMGSWHCGSVACIGGWTTYLYGDPAIDGAVGQVAELLGISEMEAIYLCYPDECDKIYARITPEDAAKVLRHLAKTGDVRWSVIEP